MSDLHLFSFFFFTGETDAGGEGVAIDVYLLICGTRGPTLSDARTTPTLGAPIDGPGALLSSSVDSSFFFLVFCQGQFEFNDLSCRFFPLSQQPIFENFIKKFM